MQLKNPQQLVSASSMASQKIKILLYDSFMKKSGVDAAKLWALSQKGKNFVDCQLSNALVLVNCFQFWY